MQQWSEAQIMESFRHYGFLEGRRVPRIPENFAVRYRQMNDDIDNRRGGGRGGGGGGEGGGDSEEEMPVVKSKTRWRKTATRPDVVTLGYVPSHLRRDRALKDDSRPNAVTLESDGKDDEKIKRVAMRAPPTIETV